MTVLKNLPNGISVFSLNGNETDYLYREIFHDESYIPPGGVTLAREPVVLDVGANIGLFTIFAAQKWPGARIFSFEPVPDVFDVLRKNAGHLPGVTLHNTALGAEERSLTMTYYPNYTMMSGFDADPAADRALAASFLGRVVEDVEPELQEEFLDEVREMLDESLAERQLVDCAVTRLDAFTADAGLDRVDFLKIDVEGFEVRVLEGIGPELWPKIANAAVEVADRDGALAAVTGHFERNGLRTVVRQAAEYHGSDLHTVFARREG
ncbi:FkbM family methyltransferase [Streptomyces sp. rh34]|uniref:FkbM family methyltransferase n=1 Tax=Streptomyces sp. rh34 TaxID=2034272 RepID=UPI0015CF8019|nr:FkbM family methyltransferase [Streptomyces sp. rh34]